MKVMIRNTAFVGAEAAFAEAAMKMRDRKLCWLHVLNNARSVGVIAEKREIMTRSAAQGLNPVSTRVRDVMSADVLHCSVDEQVMNVVTKAARKKIGWAIVLDRDHKPVGMVPLGEENH